jgi:hypothetical protein
MQLLKFETTVHVCISMAHIIINSKLMEFWGVHPSPWGRVLRWNLSQMGQDKMGSWLARSNLKWLSCFT